MVSCALKVKFLLLCEGSPANSTEGSDRRLLVYQHCIPLCESGDLQTEVAADIIGLLMLEVKKNPTTTTTTEKSDHDAFVLDLLTNVLP